MIIFEDLLESEVCFRSFHNFELLAILKTIEGIRVVYKIFYNFEKKEWNYELEELSMVLEKDFSLYKNLIEAKFMYSFSLQQKKYEKYFSLFDLQSSSIEKYLIKKRNNGHKDIFLSPKKEIFPTDMFIYLNKDDLIRQIHIEDDDFIFELTGDFVEKKLPNLKQIKNDILRKDRVRLLF